MGRECDPFESPRRIRREKNSYRDLAIARHFGLKGELVCAKELLMWAGL